MLERIREDLWQTQAYSPFPGLNTHAYLWTPPTGENVLFYSPGDDTDFDALDELGGVAHQYLSHQDEAGPLLTRIADRFGARLHASEAEAAEVGQHVVPQVRFATRHVDELGIEVIPTPGHTPGSTCFLVPGADGTSYLFTGDTVFLSDEGVWTAGFIPGMSEAAELLTSLRLLSTLEPDLVVSSAFQGDNAAVRPGAATTWAAGAEQAIATLPQATEATA